MQPTKSIQQENPKKQKKPSEVEDILIKLVNLLANLSVHPNVGKYLAADQDCISHLIQILGESCENSQLMLIFLLLFNTFFPPLYFHHL